MTWRNLQFAHLHAARAVGVSAITPNATFVAGDEKYLIDDRPSVRFKWTDSAANHIIDVDLGAGYAALDIDRLWIPNHNISGEIKVWQDDAADFVGMQQILVATAVAGTDMDEAFDLTQSAQFLRFIITPAGAWELGQLMYSKTITLEAGPATGWVDEWIPNVLQLPSGDTLQTDPDQRLMEFTWLQAGLAAATDLTKLEALIAAVSTYRPFLLDPPYDSEAVRFVKLTERARKNVNTLVPASATRTAEVRLSMLDFLG